MAKQLGERFGISACFSELSGNVRRCVSDVVHITTPPQSHYSLAKQCLESGSHVYLEKPFTITAGEAESLIRLAERRDLKITAGHNLQFTPETLEMRQLLAARISRRKTGTPGKPFLLRSRRHNLRRARSSVIASIGFVNYRDNCSTTSSAME